MAKIKKDKRVNCDYTVKDNKLVITIDLSKECKPSASGKSYILASTGGNISLVGEYKDIKLGINAYIPKSKYEEKQQAQQNRVDTIKMVKEAKENVQLREEVSELKDLVAQLLQAQKV